MPIGSSHLRMRHWVACKHPGAAATMHAPLRLWCSCPGVCMQQHIPTCSRGHLGPHRLMGWYPSSVSPLLPVARAMRSDVSTPPGPRLIWRDPRRLRWLLPLAAGLLAPPVVEGRGPAAAPLAMRSAACLPSAVALLLLLAASRMLPAAWQRRLAALGAAVG